MKLSTEALKKLIDGWITPAVRQAMAARFDPPPNLDKLTWVREEKRRLAGDDWLDFVSIDMFGAKLAPVTKGRWVRVFTPRLKGDVNDHVAGSFRIEVVTDAEDRDVMFWNLVVD